MKFEIVDLNKEQIETLDSKLEEYDMKHIKYKLSGNINIGIIKGDSLIAGVNGCMTAYKIFYISTVFVDESYRNQGFGRKLMESIELKAVSLGANMIRLDTFDWQGSEFYKKLGYEQVGSYNNKIDGFSEYFFLKKLFSE